MTHQNLAVKDIEPLVNVRLLNGALLRTKDRPGHLPGIVGFYGPAGYGKTCAATLLANEHDAAHVELKSYWNRKTFFEALYLELGITGKARTIGDMGKAISAYLGKTKQPLIIDEIDIAIKKGFVDDVRAIFEDSRTVVIVIGEESLCDDLRRWDRFHSRVLEWVPAEAPALEDTRALAGRFCPDVDMDEKLLLRIHHDSGKSVRRICVNLEMARGAARELGMERLDLETWESFQKTFYTGAAPTRGNGPKPRR